MSEPENMKPQENPHLPAPFRPGHGQIVPSASGPYPPVPRTAGPQAFGAKPLSPATILRSLRRRWLIAACLAVIAVPSVVAGAWFLLPPQPNVRSVLHIATTPPKVIFDTADNSGLTREDFSNFQKTQAALVKSRLVLNAALREPKVAQLSVLADKPDPLDWLEQELKVDNNIAPEFLRISMDGEKAQDLAVLVSAVTKAYLTEIVNADHNKRLDRLAQIKNLRMTAEADLRAKRKDLRDYAELVGSGDKESLALTHKFALEQLDMAKKGWMQCRSELMQLKVELETKADAKPREVPSVPPELVDPQMKLDSSLSEDFKTMASLEETIRKAKEGSAPAKKAKVELDELKKKIDERRKELTAALARQMAAKARFDQAQNADQRVDKYTALQRLEKLYKTEVDRLTQECQKINKGVFEAQSLKDEISQSELSVQDLAREEQKLKVEVQAPPRVHLLEDAVTSLRNAERRRYMGMGIGGVAALALSLFGVVFFDLRGRRVSTQDDIIHGLGMQIVGSVPYILPPNSRRKGRQASSPAHLAGERVFAESIDTTRTVLLHAAKQHSLQVVMITSALGGEGKTSLSCHLAASMAYAGVRTLLMDLDLRKPSVHKVFDVPVSPGMSDLLVGTAQLADVIRETGTDRLSLLPAGNLNDEGLKALARGAAKPIFDQVRKQFDFVIVDSCPVLPVSDSLVIAQEVDAVMFSIFREVSRLPAVQAAWNRLAAIGVRMLGAVVNGDEQHTYGYGYNSYYSYYSSAK
jgi:capsular exopolysaccharide synthesis family protein